MNLKIPVEVKNYRPYSYKLPHVPFRDIYNDGPGKESNNERGGHSGVVCKGPTLFSPFSLLKNPASFFVLSC